MQCGLGGHLTLLHMGECDLGECDPNAKSLTYKYPLEAGGGAQVAGYLWRYVSGTSRKQECLPLVTEGSCVCGE